MAAMRVAVLLGLLFTVVLHCCGAQDGPTARSISLGSNLSVTLTGSISPGGHARFELANDDNLSRCYEPATNAAGEETTRFLHVEMWNTEAIEDGVSPHDSSSQAEPRADPMLMVANSMTEPTATYQTHQSDWTWTPDDTLTDYEGYRLMRNYQHIITEATESPIYSDPWNIAISNIDIWMTRELQYTLRVSCVVEEPCPSASTAETCSGHGTCTAGTCACDRSGTEAWGDVSCDVRVQQLDNDVTVSGAQADGLWSYYVLKVPEGSDMLLVDMDRVKGDPVLFVKHQEDGFSAGSLPAVMDYESYADQDSFRSRLNFHHISITFPKPGVYYVGVYNNDVYIKERTVFRLTARWSTTNSLRQVFCPADCNGNGDCVSLPTGPVCNCDSGYGGELCEGRHTMISLGTEVVESLQPAEWAYYRLRLGKSGRWDEGLVVEFNTNVLGHPVLILKRDEYPSMLNNDYIFTSSQMLQGRKRFKLAAGELVEGDYIFGIFNMDYYKHERMEYTFSVDAYDESGLMPFTPYMSIVLGVTVSLFLCLFMSICKRLVQRHGLFGHPPPEHDAAAFHVHVRPDGSRGVDRAVIESFPTFEYMVPEDVDEEAKGEGDVDSEGLPSCAVCLCSYETGEMMRKLPCSHEFHMKCIDQWLTQRTTCPMCRVALVSESTVRGMNGEEGAGVEGAERDPQGAVDPPRSPPGSAEETEASRHTFLDVNLPTPAGPGRALSASGASSSSGAPPPEAEPLHGSSAPSGLRQMEMVVICDLTDEEPSGRNVSAP